MADGYSGKILTVDLSKNTIREETIPDEVYDKYLAGTGLGAYICYREIPAKVDPLGPDNLIGFMAGILTGSGYPFSGRWSVVGKSPLTGCWGDANCGGNFAPGIRRSGYDGIFFKGTSKKPVYLKIDSSNKAELCDASHLWGKDAIETEEILLNESKGKARVACIGPAGEKLSLISGISNDRGRIAARSGLGAVMGSKKLKAVVLEGKYTAKIHNKETIKSISQKVIKLVKLQTLPVSGKFSAVLGWIMGKIPIGIAMDGMLFKMMLKKWGTVSLNRMSIHMGDSPIKNWKGTTKDFKMGNSESIDPDAFLKYEKKKYHCYACPLGCGGICETKGKFKETHKPEYETVLALGGLCMNEDIDSIFYLNELLNRAGMDSISAGATAAYAMECFENGLISKDDTEGIELKWGDFNSVTYIIEMMIKREGIGDLLADGVKAAAKKIGNNSEQYAVHAGGQELPMHDGRNDPGFALHYAIEPSPGKHTVGAWMYYEMFQIWKVIKSYPSEFPFNLKKNRFSTKDKAKKAAACSQIANVINGSGLCIFGMLIGIKRVKLFEALNAVTGWEKSPENYMEIGGRIQTLKQAFNIKHGIDPKSLKPNQRAIGEPPQSNGMNRGNTVPIDILMEDYWENMGWDRNTGKPPGEVL